jgi:Ca2+-binding EF-hand superfamily protein
MKDAVRRIQEDRLRENGDHGDGMNDDAEWVTLDALQKVLERYRSVLQRDRTSNFQHMFRLMDRDNKGFIQASDVTSVAVDLGEPLSIEEAHGMIVATRQLVDADVNEEHVEDSINFVRFQKLFAPPQA